jgi:hypothetical protein
MTSLCLGDVPLAATDEIPHRLAPPPAAGYRIALQRRNDRAVAEAPAGAD